MPYTHLKYVYMFLVLFLEFLGLAAKLSSTPDKTVHKPLLHAYTCVIVFPDDKGYNYKIWHVLGVVRFLTRKGNSKNKIQFIFLSKHQKQQLEKLLLMSENIKMLYIYYIPVIQCTTERKTETEFHPRIDNFNVGTQIKNYGNLRRELKTNSFNTTN